MNASFREIARTMDTDNPPTRLSDLFSRHRWLPGTHPSWRQIALRHENAIKTKFLSLNTYLMGSPGSKPEVDDRSNEIGDRLRVEGYDVMALCEVWDQSIISEARSSQAFKLRILHAFGWNEDCGEHDWPNHPLDDRYARGPGPAYIKIDSGLLQICANPSLKIVDHATSEGQYFTKLGSMFEGGKVGDYWSEKGILLTRIDVGLAGLATPAGTGSLEVFSTHLYSGDDPEVYKSNLDELSAFFLQHHCPQSVALITGDINIDALNPDEEIAYGYLKDHMNDRHLNMEDLWLTHWGSKDQPGYNGVWNPGGYTSSCPIDDDDPEQISQIKWVSGDENILGYCKEPGLSPQELTDRMCHINPAVFCVTDPDPIKRQKKQIRGRRIDYIFLQRPDPCQCINVDVTRIRRRAFRRDSQKSRAPESKMQFLTDHFGLDLTLVISRR